MSPGDLLASFRGRRALVVGDVMLDEYLYGRAARVSVEAPVLILRHERVVLLPGGAANVARNLAAFGAETTVVGVAGCDEAGDALDRALNEDPVRGVIVRDPGRPTTRKTRVLADASHQVLRIDHESQERVGPEVENALLRTVEAELDGVDVVVLSDYVKGALTPRLIAEMVRAGRARGAAVVANAKPRSFGGYAGASLVSLNRPEATEALGLPDLVAPEGAPDAAARLAASGDVDAVLVTLGDQGMAAASRTESLHVPAQRPEVFDATGAGDTTIATVALGIASVGFRRDVFQLAAHTAAAVIAHAGVAVPSSADLHRIAALSFSEG